jgi:GNAT superfamily N-acetyltransferase
VQSLVFFKGYPLVITYYLGREETLAYVRDFLRRLHKLDHVPTVWCPITKSGLALVEIMADLINGEFSEFQNVRIFPIEVDGTIRFREGEPSEVLRGQSVLLLDGAIHSGKMMNDCAAKVLEFAPSALSSYALVMKRGSIFIPTFWGVMIEETDRALFLLPAIPNQRLDATGDNPTKKQPSVHLERLNKNMLTAPLIESGVQSLDRIRWSDRYFQMEATEFRTCTYLLKRGSNITGYLTLHVLDGGGLMVDEVAVHPEFRGVGLAGVLMRFADTLARQGNCPVIRLLAIREQVEMYKRFDFREVAGKALIQLDNEAYQLMEKVVLYHQSPIR